VSVTGRLVRREEGATQRGRPIVWVRQRAGLDLDKVVSVWSCQTDAASGLGPDKTSE